MGTKLGGCVISKLRKLPLWKGAIPVVRWTALKGIDSGCEKKALLSRSNIFQTLDREGDL